MRFLLVISLLSLFYGSSDQKRTRQICKDPTESELKAILSEAFKTNLMDELTKSSVYYYPNTEDIKGLIVSESKVGMSRLINGYTKCDLVEQTKWSINHNTLCPHHFVEERRTNRYPFILARAVCNCERCIGLPDNHLLTYSCTPITIYKLVLVRGRCLSNKVYLFNLN